ncbi:MAG TPA: IS110 family transposase [Segetibacter sp.]|nr:IS110 family transposase [Segetibacter sp.]
MNKKTKKNSKQMGTVAMPLVNPNAAGIDVGSTMHAVAVPAGRDNECIKIFGSFTEDLKEIIKWLIKCGIETVAMESTGVYWKPLFNMLIQHGFEAYLVNSKHTRNVTGRKNDESDAAWIQRLHSCGLLKSSFLPDDHQETLRTLVRHRRTLINDSSRHILRMQKALELMNVKIHIVINDITGKTGTAIIEKIIAGQREAEDFISCIDSRIKADHQTILKSLKGNWRSEHLFTLKQSFDIYKYLQQQITVCEKEIEQVLQQYIAIQNEGIIQEATAMQKAADNDSKKNYKRKRKTKNQPLYNTRKYLHHIHGVDVMAIYGLSETSGLEILAETGTDLKKKWPTDKNFVSWLNLCSNNKISGGKLISSTVLKLKPNLAAQAFRQAANGVKKSNNWLGEYFRRLKTRGGHKHAIVATAHKIATIYYKMVTEKTEFCPVPLNEYQQKYNKAKIAWFEKKLAELKRQVA